MVRIKWEKKAAGNFKAIMGELPLHRTEQVNEWLDLIRDWPPSKWYQLRDEGGFIGFRLDNDKFLRILGRFNETEGVVWITHFERKMK
jgi:hypothetical protein